MKAVYLKQGNNRVVSVPYYRIGDLFLTTIATNPSDYLGGTWELFGPGRVLVCVDTSQTEFNSVKKTGGSKYLQQHYHKGISFGATGPSEQDVMVSYVAGSGNRISLDWSRPGTIGNNQSNINTYNEGQGDSQNLQPFITCYVWIRIA